ncbi:DUF4329 domain-containing protein [Thalassorhabdomicrobium marinisediminis]|uniref:DUF4329 domain-containing protein n=1 Tax=Thalassorhabdomicrobium marinisediminis TaxID=2170577 RepID=UPI0024926A60|nr:DUF4329 domain-containing protein [Thalassorhabdomicrobium marinisediminis]
MIRTAATLALVSLTLSACAAPPTPTGLQPMSGPGVPQTAPVVYSVAPPNAPRGPAVDAFAKAFLDDIQAASIADRREYCGYFYITPEGQLRGTPPRIGTFATCDMPEPRPGQGIIASYHTHGAYGGGYDNEVPSAIDLTSDFDYGINGYVSTPGGRVWLVDFQTLTTRQVCGLGCITMDPRFQPQDEAGIRISYTVPDLRRRNSGGH